MGSFTAVRRMPPAIFVLALIGLVAAAVAAYAAPSPAIQTFTPHSEKQITNLDVLRQQIRNYYGDPLGTGTFAADSNYAQEAQGVAEDGGHYLASQARGHHDRHTGHNSNPAIILDVDDTSLATWNYEVFSNWAFNPTTNGDFVTQQKFPAVPGMVDLATQAAKEGYAIFFLTGRGAAQEPATLGNLTSDGVGVDAGYPQPTTLSDGEDGLFTKPAVANYPDYLKAACAGDPNGSCTTVHYKSATRAHIESLGYEIVGNFGDQFSDLEGGHADKTFKLPNPNYFLP
jgi:hypothetical protein